MKKKNKEPKDLGIKIGTKEEAFWTQVKKETKITIEKLEITLKFEKAVLDMCLGKIALEKNKKV